MKALSSRRKAILLFPWRQSLCDELGGDDQRKAEIEKGTYDIDTAVSGNGNDGIKSAEIDTCRAHC